MTSVSDIKSFAELILGETIDDDFFYFLINMFKDNREENRAWNMLMALDSSQTASTAAQALPTAWRRTTKLVVGTSYFPYTQVRFDQQHMYRNNAGKYFIDVANSTYKLLGNLVSTGAVNHYYLKTTPTITDSVTPTWPARFWPILGFEIAGYIMGGQDADDVFARLSPVNRAQAALLVDNMENWDDNLQISAQDGRAGMGDEDLPEVSLETMG